jgi:membrane associated rhomboid family serine protease
MPWALCILITSNIVIYILPYLLFRGQDGPKFIESMTTFYKTYGLVPAALHPYTLITSLFLHGGVSHLLQNMYFLWLFGEKVETQLGKTVFLLVYFTCGVFGGLTHAYMHPNFVPCVGASAALSGIMGFSLILFRSESLELVWFWEIFKRQASEDTFHMPSTAWILMWMIANLWLGLLTAGATALMPVAVWGHIGGAVLGLIIGLLFKAGGFYHEPSADEALDQPAPSSRHADTAAHAVP